MELARRGVRVVALDNEETMVAYGAYCGLGWIGLLVFSLSLHSLTYFRIKRQSKGSVPGFTLPCCKCAHAGLAKADAEGVNLQYICGDMSSFNGVPTEGMYWTKVGYKSQFRENVFV